MKKGESLKTHIYNALIDGIIKGEYLPNDILSEKSLVDKFNVSKSPVREALIELCNEGILRSIPRYGYEVLKISDNEIKEIQDFRLLLECNCVSKYWDMLTFENILLLEKTFHDNYFDYTEYNAVTHWEKNSQFHLTLISFFNNKYIYDILKSSLRTLTIAYAQFYWDKWRKQQFRAISGGHEQFIECLKAGNKQGALRALEWDISEFHEL